MKFSLKLPEEKTHHNPLLKAKLPITIFTQPFTSSITTATNSSSDLSFSLSTNFPSGPSIKLSYSPSSSSSFSPSSPFSLSLKSGLGVFGSPNSSPLIFSANFSLLHAKPIVPIFSLHLKPQFGNFCLKKSTFSNPSGDRIPGSHSDGGVNPDPVTHSDVKIRSGFVLDDSTGWQELKLESCSGNGSTENSRVHLNGGTGCLSQRSLVEENFEKDGLLSGISVIARTSMPVTKEMTVNLRWGVNFPANLGNKMPYLTVNKVSIERIEEVKEVKKKMSAASNLGDLELLKGMCLWMRRDFEVLEKENREMKQILKEMKMEVTRKSLLGENDGLGRKDLLYPGEAYSEFERWRNKKNGEEENGRKSSSRTDKEGNGGRNKTSAGEENSRKNNRSVSDKNGRTQVKSVDRVSEVESELQRAIMAASR